MDPHHQVIALYDLLKTSPGFMDDVIKYVKYEIYSDIVITTVNYIVFWQNIYSIYSITPSPIGRCERMNWHYLLAGILTVFVSTQANQHWQETFIMERRTFRPFMARGSRPTSVSIGGQSRTWYSNRAP